MLIDFAKLFNAYVGAHQKKWGHDRSQSVGASEVFGCLRKAWFAKHDTKQDATYKQSWGALQRGDLIENHFVEPAIKWALENVIKGAKLIWGGKDQKTLIEGRLSATPDGLVIGAADDALAEYGIASLGGTGCFNLEIKSIDPRVNLKEEKAIHRGQVQTQMGLTRLKTRYKPNYAVILYIDASFFDDIDVFVVPFDQRTFDAAQTRAKDVFEIDSPEKIMPEGKFEGGCEYCPFQQACNQSDEIHTPQDGVADNSTAELAILEEFEDLARRERAANAEKKSAIAKHEKLAEELKFFFRDTGVKRAVSADGGIKAAISWIKGRKSYDVEAMRADGVDVEKYAKIGDGHSRLTISERGATRAEEE